MAEWIENEENAEVAGEGQTAEPVMEGLEPEPVEEVEPEEELAPTYQGKSVKDVAKMHSELEKVMARQGNELAALRQQVQQTHVAQPEPEEPSTDVDYFTDPKAAVNSSIENHEVIKEFKQATAQMKRDAGVQALVNKHSDMAEIISSEEFKVWAQATPVRQRLHYEADQMFSVEAADELISNFKEIKGMANTAKKAGSKARKSAVKSASTGSPSSNPESGNSRKIVNGAELRRKAKADPDWYEANQPEIMRAYAEGRVQG